METKASAYYLTAVALLSQSKKIPSVSLSDGTIEDIQESVKLFGGTVYVTDESNYHSIYYRSSIGDCTLWIHTQSTNLACTLQRESFQSNEFIFEKGTDLLIIDNHLVFKD
jgi:hypothetical protein